MGELFFYQNGGIAGDSCRSIRLMLRVSGHIAEFGGNKVDQRLWREYDLATAYAGAYADFLEKNCGFVNPEREFLFHADRRTTAAHIARGGKKISEGQHFNFPVAACRRRLFQIQFATYGNAENADAGSVTRGDECFENLLLRHSDERGDMSA